jgi:hypothetical protein
VELSDVDVEFMTEIDGSVVDFALQDGSPEIELVSTRFAAVTIVDIPLDVYRELRIPFVCGGMLGERTWSTPLIAASGRRLEVNEFQDPADGDFPAQGSIVDGRHVTLAWSWTADAWPFSDWLVVVLPGADDMTSPRTS